MLVLAASCGRRPDDFAPPRQRSLNLGNDPEGLEPFIRMDDPRVDAYIVRDISTERGVFRWTFLNPELRLRVDDNKNLRFAMEFAIPEVTFKVTGPVTVSCAINGHPLTSMRCPHVGKFRMEEPVPAEWVEPRRPIHVTFHAEPRWVSPEDGQQLSFLLFNAGFVQ